MLTYVLSRHLLINFRNKDFLMYSGFLNKDKVKKMLQLKVNAENYNKIETEKSIY